MDAIDKFLKPEELIVDKRTGKIRQAGTSMAGEYVEKFRLRCEESLYVFSKAVLGNTWLSPTLHKPTADWIMRVPPRRKMLLLPRGHGKTILGGQSLVLHMLIQDKARNPYFPGEAGADVRILLIGENLDRAKDHVRVISTHLEENQLLRGLWPQIAWDNPRRDSKRWNETELIVPRSQEFSDPTLRGIGVGGAITGAHPTVLIKDDLTTKDAANSEPVMRDAIEYHVASRALLSRPTQDLEFIYATRWAVHDLAGYVLANDPSVSRMVRGVVENGRPIWPENPNFTLAAIEDLRREFGTLFPLLYMNNATDRSLTDFNPSDIRDFTISAIDGSFMFEEDERDARLRYGMTATNVQRKVIRDEMYGKRLDKMTFERLRLEHLRRVRS